MSKRPSADRRVALLLSEREFRKLFLSQSLSAFGSMLIPVTMAVTVLRIGGSLTDLGIVLGVGSATQLAMLLAGGVLADRLPRRATMWVVDSARAALAIAFALSFLFGQVRLWQFIALSFFEALGTAIYFPASVGLVKTTVPARLQQQAEALMSFSLNASRLVGPALAVGLLALGNPGTAYLVDGLTFAVSAVLISRMKVPEREPAPRQRFLRDLAEGWQEVKSHRWFWQSLISHGLWNMGFCALFVLGPAVTAYAHGGRDWAAIVTAFAVGSVLGTLAALRLRVSRPLIAVGLAMALGAAPLAALALHQSQVVVILATVVAALGLSVFTSLWVATTMQLIPEQRLSRVSSFDSFVSFSIVPISYALTPVIANAFGIDTALMMCALIVFASGGLTMFSSAIRNVFCDATGLVTARRPDSPADEVPAGRPATEDARSVS